MLDNPEKLRIASHEGLREFYAGRPALVIGADGFLGVNCVYALQALGADVSVISRRPNPRAVGFNGKVFRGDLASAELCHEATREASIVFNFAGCSGPAESNRDPVANLQLESLPQLTLLTACAESPCQPLVVFCSSRVVYGRPDYLPVDESHPIRPESMYAVHKVAAEHYLNVFRRTRGLRSCVMRLSNPYGPNEKPDSKTYGLINRFIRLALERQPITIYGQGDQLRDYIHVDDVLLAFLLVAAEPACHGETFNLGAREPIRMRDAVKAIAEATGGTEIRHIPWPDDFKAVETGDYYTDLSKLDRFVGLPPQLSFRDGLAEMLGG